jgi:hypothetical protein
MKQRITTRYAIATIFAVSVLTLPTVSAKPETQAELQSQARVTKASAEKTALTKVVGGTIKSGEIENEHGKLVWSFDIKMPHSRNITEVQVDAKSGKIVAIEQETPSQQAKEAKEDRAQKH